MADTQVKPIPQNLASLVLRIGGPEDGYPEGCNAHITPDGEFKSDDGRPASMTGGALTHWRMDAAIAAKLKADLQASGKPILYDYEHNSLWGDSRAAGWIVDLVYVEGRGLFAKVEWTPTGTREIADKEYRCSSPLFYFDPTTGDVVELVSVALTNNPALGNLDAVALARQAALTGRPIGALALEFLTTAGNPGDHTTGDTDMATPEQVAALTAERDTAKTQVAALTAETEAQKTKITALTAEVAALTAEKQQAKKDAEQKEKDDLITAACSGDKPKMTPAVAETVKGMPLADLKKFIDTLGSVALTSTQADNDAGGDKGNHGLNADQMAWCSRMGVTPEQFVAAQKQ